MIAHHAACGTMRTRGSGGVTGKGVLFMLATLQNLGGLGEEEARTAAAMITACRKELLAEQQELMGVEGIWERTQAKAERRMRPRCEEERRQGVFTKAHGAEVKMTADVCRRRHKNRVRSMLRNLVVLGWLKAEDRPEPRVQPQVEYRIRDSKTKTRITRNLLPDHKLEHRQRGHSGRTVTSLAIRIVCGVADAGLPLG